jgi:hypothetical protein
MGQVVLPPRLGRAEGTRQEREDALALTRDAITPARMSSALCCV